jgi:signal transduction histidine kinase
MIRDVRLREHFALASASGSYYYIKRLDIRPDCLPCHGGPRGTRDISGYPREGLAVGDFGGAISVRIPAAGLIQNSRQRAWLQLAFGVVLAAVAIALTFHLLRRMTRLSVDLSRANADLERQNTRMTLLEKQKGDLFHMLIHDMKAPLSFMIGSLQMLQEQKVGPLNAEQDELAALVLRGCHRLENMISNLLDINRLEEGKLELRVEEVDLQRLMADRGRPWIQLARRQHKVFDIRLTSRHALLHCDRNLLDRILENLISNAFKHTHERAGEIRLEISDWENPVGVLFRLVDNGEGIPKEFTDRIFEKYSVVQGQELGLKTDTGLGLAFCRLAVQAMGGNIWVESAPGQGTSFFFNLPLSR